MQSSSTINKLKSQGKHQTESTCLANPKHPANGVYFITICTNNCISHFADGVDSGKVQLTAIGKIAQQYFINIPSQFKYTCIDTYVVMPNHIHGIIVIDKSKNIVGKRYDFLRKAFAKASAKGTSDESKKISPLEADSLETIIETYKSAVTQWCHNNGYQDFQWQEKFYQGIVPPDVAVDGIRRYIIKNPDKWEQHKNHPPDLWM